MSMGRNRQAQLEHEDFVRNDYAESELQRLANHLNACPGLFVQTQNPLPDLQDWIDDDDDDDHDDAEDDDGDNHVEFPEETARETEDLMHRLAHTWGE